MKLRTVQFTIQPFVVADDGETLHPVTMEPVTVAATDMPAFGDRFAAYLATREAEMVPAATE